MAGEKSPWLFELVAGIIEQDEVAEQVAKREAFEEAGLTVKSCQFMLNYLVSPGGTTEQVDLFIANVDSTVVGGLYGLAHEGEDIRAHIVPRETAYQWVKEGKIYNAATIIALQWLELNKDDLII
jgi:ADP-ribose pyrophosphatase